NAYYLLRSGKIIQLVESRLGGYAGRVMEVLLQLGHARVSYLETISELMEHTGKKDKQRKRRKLAGGEVKTENDGLQVEGVDDVDAEGEAEAEVGEEEEEVEDDDTIPPLHPTLNALASHGFILRVRDAHFQSPGDLQEDAAQTLRGRSDIRALKGKRQEEAIINGVENLVRERTDGNIKTAGPDLRAEARGRKRKVKMGAADTNRGQEEEGVEKARKRLKVEMDDGESDDERMYGQEDMMEEDEYDEHAEPLDSAL
ncbi:RNA polymerase III subunit C82, partial [Ascosphaera atra]